MRTAVAPATLPYEWYVDPAVLRLEQERIFGRFWQYVGHVGRLSEPGAFTTARAGELPILIVRGRDDELRAFVNVCRHRGFLLCEGDGRRETIQCPYHAWTYDLDGSLRSAPRADSEPGFDRKGISLAQVAVDTWGPFVFVNPDVHADPLRDYLGSLPELLAAAGIDVETLRFHLRAESEPYACNWKVCAENFLECYHCAIAHPSLARAIDVSPSAYELETDGFVSTQVGPPRNGGDGVYDATGPIARGQFHFLFPSTAINVMPGQANLSIGPMIPTGAETTVRFLDYFVGADTDDAWLADFLYLDERVGAEDRVLVERVQRGIRGGGLEGSLLLPDSEQLIAHFQALVAEALSSDGP